MLFNSFQFASFFAIVFALCVVLRRRARVGVLLGSSFVFYGLWHPAYVLLLIALITVNFVLARGIARGLHPKRLLVASITLTLGTLAVFKYADFAVGLATPVLVRSLGIDPPAPDILLPLGISFYSFEMISFATDVHRGRLKCPTFGLYALFVAFFPHLIAGPILRGGELLPQLDAGGERTSERTRRGLWLFAVGLGKKTILADFLLAPFVDEIFSTPGAASGPIHLVAAYSFAFLIYFDFSGYTDMARGLACILGFELPMNFAEPYLSRDPMEFWRRWHTTLSRWLRDYIYIPLGGNRRGASRTLVNLMLTMLLGGLWHGADVKFVIWGGLHGVLLAAYRALGVQRSVRGARLDWADVARILVTFHLICLVWVPFRAPTWSDTVLFWSAIARGDFAHGWPTLPLFIVVLCAALHVAERVLRTRLPAIHSKLARSPWGPVLEGGMLGGIVMACILASGAGTEFIYFQF